MKGERPIIFSGESVRAILDGRKVQTRRLIKPRRPDDIFGYYPGDRWHVEEHPKRGWWAVDNPAGFDDGMRRPAGESGFPCPCGAPSDRLWVREAFAIGTASPEQVFYRANRLPGHANTIRWRPSIYMPRWASRLTLDLVAVRVERLQEIRCGDIRAEGVDCPTHDFPGGFCSSECADLRAAFAAGWDALNGKRAPWADNPWVWVLTFSLVKETP